MANERSGDGNGDSVDYTRLFSDLSDFRFALRKWDESLAWLEGSLPGSRPDRSGHLGVIKQQTLELGDWVVKAYVESIAPRLKKIEGPLPPPLSFL